MRPEIPVPTTATRTEDSRGAILVGRGGVLARSERFLTRLCSRVGQAFADVVRDNLQVPRQAELLQRLEEVPADVDFPPVETEAGRSGEVVMVVVPGLAEGDRPEPGVVARLVTGLVALGPPSKTWTSELIVNVVVREDGADDAAPHQQLPSARAGSGHRHNPLPRTGCR